MLGYPPPPRGPRRLTDQPNPPFPPPLPDPQKFAPGWGLEFEQAAPRGGGTWVANTRTHAKTHACIRMK